VERLTLTENQSERAGLALSGVEAAALNQTGLVQAIPVWGGGWEVSPCVNMVGAIRVGERDIVVQPKASFSSLLFMLAYVHDPGFNPAEFDGLADDDLWPAVGETLIRLTQRALAGGVLRGYVTMDDRLPVVRGRIRLSDQLTRRHGIPVPLEVRYSDYSSDIPENQILRAALRRMASVERLPDDTIRNLRHLESQLNAASVWTPGISRPVWTPNRSNARYVPALRLAELILDSVGLSTSEGDHPVASFVINMAVVFESFVSVALGEALKAVSTGITREQYPGYLTYDKRFPIRPDVVHLIGGEPRAVYDAKYKLEERLDDLYQMHAYCTVLGLDAGHLVYAGSRFSPDDADATIRNAGVTIRIHPLDVRDRPTGLLHQVHQIVRTSLVVHA
jgi:5-methylcytosine-specific restriction enzyme subunit McrC